MLKPRQTPLMQFPGEEPTRRDFVALGQRDPASYYQQTPLMRAAMEGLLPSWIGQAFQQDVMPAYEAAEKPWEQGGVQGALDTMALPAQAVTGLLKGAYGDLKGAMDNPTPESVFPLAVDVATGGLMGSAVSRIPKGALGANVWQGGPHKYGPGGAVPAAKKAAGAFQEMTRAKKLAAGYYEMSDGGRTVAIENRPGIGWVNTADWERGLVSDPWRTKAAAETDARKWLERNGEPLPLPMDEASRMARAKEMGFDTDVYQGSFSDFRQYETGHKGASSNETASLGHWFTDRPEVAGRFTERPSKTYSPRVDAKTGQPKTWDDGEIMKYADPDEVGHIKPLRAKIDNPLVFETDGTDDAFEKMMDFRDQWTEYIDGVKGKTGHWRRQMAAKDAEGANAKFQQFLKEKGHGGIELRGTLYDSPDGLPSTQFVIPPGLEKNIRSRFAKFDLAKAGSRDILAGIAGAGLLGGPALQGLMQEEQY
tara:strand:+ start:7154 stop:8593 length:1440 start_codon:yes stop_codon:yes gene_type:complete